MSNEIKEESFAEQIATLVRVTAELKGRWIIQKFQFEEWRRIILNPLMLYDPVHECWAPICGVTTYATSSEAADAIQTLQAQCDWTFVTGPSVVENATGYDSKWKHWPPILDFCPKRRR